MIDASKIDIIIKKFNDKIEFLEEDKVLLVKDILEWFEIAKFLKNDEQLNFDYLMCITSYDTGDSKNFGLAYNFNSTKLKHSVEVRLEFVDGTEVKSIESLWKAADWHEREAFDMMGITIVNHPDMKRILLPHDWEGYPLRKDYKTPDYYNGMPVPKDKSYWE
tara:strand:- start:239 stop:727 length:489 start_codon:yes stop_codon:yes gene_type:complete